jgi:hypothetical protein
MSIPDELGKLIAHDSRSLDQDHDDNLVALFRHRQDRGDFTDLARIKHHPAHRILKDLRPPRRSRQAFFEALDHGTE